MKKNFNFKISWLGDPKRFEGFNPNVILDQDFNVDEYPNFENNGDGRSFYVYLRDVKSGIYKKALKIKKMSGFLMLFLSTGINNLASVYGWLDSNSSMVIQLCNYMIFIMLFFAFNLKNIDNLASSIKKLRFRVYKNAEKL